jgi:hypothetical protein
MVLTAAIDLAVTTAGDHDRILVYGGAAATLDNLAVSHPNDTFVQARAGWY